MASNIGSACPAQLPLDDYQVSSILLPLKRGRLALDKRGGAGFCLHCSSILCTQVCLCRIDCELTQRAFTHIPSCCNHAMHTQDSTHTCADWHKSGVVHLCSLLMRTGGINSQKVSCRFDHINDEYKYDRRHGRDVKQTCGVHAAICRHVCTATSS